jgi:hypothetical protein
MKEATELVGAPDENLQVDMGQNGEGLQVIGAKMAPNMRN